MPPTPAPQGRSGHRLIACTDPVILPGIAIGLFSERWEQLRGELLMIGKLVAAAFVLLTACASARAQGCRELPPGPARFECASRNHPGLEAKRERCQNEARQMGLGLDHTKGMREYVEACMHRR